MTTQKLLPRDYPAHLILLRVKTILDIELVKSFAADRVGRIDGVEFSESIELDSADELTPASNWIWTHKEKGGEYEYLFEAQSQNADKAHDMITVVVYRGTDGRVWTRPYMEFKDKFARVRPREVMFRDSPSSLVKALRTDTAEEEWHSLSNMVGSSFIASDEDKKLLTMIHQALGEDHPATKALVDLLFRAYTTQRLDITADAIPTRVESSQEG